MKNERLITYKGKTQNINAWAKETGIAAGCIVSRLHNGWSVEKTLTTKPRGKVFRRYKYQGKIYTAKQLAMIHGGISRKAMQERLDNGMSVEDAVNIPRRQGKHKRPEKPVKEIKKPIVFRRAPDLTQCRTCQYRTTITSGMYPGNLCCGYALVKDRCRLLVSPPSPNCKVYVEGPSLVRAAAMKKARRGAWG